MLLLLLAWLVGSALSAKGDLECFGIQNGLQTLDLGILGFQLLQTLGIRHAHAVKLCAPCVERAIAKSMLSA